MTARRLFSFTASIYDAVLRPDSWNTVLDKFPDYILDKASMNLAHL